MLTRLYDPDKEQMVLQRTINGLVMSPKYQQLAQNTKQEIALLMLNISYSLVEIWYRDARNKFITWKFPSEYSRETILYDFQVDPTKLYNWLSKKLNITTKHLFSLMSHADDEYYARLQIYDEFSRKIDKNDQDIVNLVNRLTYRLHDTMKAIMIDYENTLIGQYPHLN